MSMGTHCRIWKTSLRTMCRSLCRGLACAGAVLALASSAQAQYNLLHQFGSTHSDGEEPFSDLTLSGSTLYGMTQYGGTNGDGVIFSLSVAVPPPLQVTSITQTGNSIAISWTTGGVGSTNELQATAGAANGSYNTNNFATIFAVTNVVGLSTNYTDVGGATNRPARYYRVASP